MATQNENSWNHQQSIIKKMSSYNHTYVIVSMYLVAGNLGPINYPLAMW